MPTKQGIIFQRVPEEVAQAIDHLSGYFQVPPERVIKAGVSIMLSMLQQNNPDLHRFMDYVKADLQHDIDRVLV